jgi:hypothetical protein
MARPKGARTKKAEDQSERFRLLEAMEFISVTQQSIGEPNQTHCTIAQQEVVGFNGIIAAGYPIDEDIVCCPNSTVLLKSLRGRPTKGMSITQLGDGRLVITAHPFRSVVPALPIGSLSYARPDPMIAPANDTLKEALSVVASVASESAQNVAMAAIHSINGAFQATDGTVLVEAWHNISFPPGLLIPKKSVEIITKVKAPIIGFGFSQDQFGAPLSLTLHYDEGAWIKTQLYQAVYPEAVSGVINAPTTYYPLSPSVFDAVATIEPLATSFIYFDKGEVRTNAIEGEGASFSAFGLPNRRCFDLKKFKSMQPYATHIDFNSQPDRVKWFGRAGSITIRGVVAGAAWPEGELAAAIGQREAVAVAQGAAGGYPFPTAGTDLDDEIPF